MRSITVAPASVHATKPGAGGGAVAGGIRGSSALQVRPVLAPMAAGLSLREMSAALAAAGTTTKAGNPWSPSTMKLA